MVHSLQSCLGDKCKTRKGCLKGEGLSDSIGSSFLMFIKFLSGVKIHLIIYLSSISEIKIWCYHGLIMKTFDLETEENLATLSPIALSPKEKAMRLKVA